MAKQYCPAEAKDFLSIGSTAIIWRHARLSGVVIKAPTEEPLKPELEKKFGTEAAILQALGPHPRIAKFLGLHQPPAPQKGLLFAEATNGNVSHYLKTYGNTTSVPSKIKWCKQAAEGLSYCHARGVLHCDLRPDNMLLDTDLNLSLCDFGGSENAEVKGGGLPDYGFFDPRDENLDVTVPTEIFGLGSCMYIFMTGHLPHEPTKITSAAYAYVEKFTHLLKQGELPDTSALKGGDIITKCWGRELNSAREVHACYQGLDEQMKMDERKSP